MKPKVNIFDGKKKSVTLSTSGFPDSRPFVFWLFCCISISDASIHENLKQFVCF